MLIWQLLQVCNENNPDDLIFEYFCKPYVLNFRTEFHILIVTSSEHIRFTNRHVDNKHRQDIIVYTNYCGSL